jgi:acyl dehydratase
MTPLYFDEVTVGAQLGAIDKGTMTTTHIMRWSAAIENFHRIHYDQPFAMGHDKLPGVLINGSWKQHVLIQMLKDSLGAGGWLWKLQFRYKKMDIAGDAVRGTAEVIDKQEVNGFGFVTLRFQLTNQNGEVSTAGTAIGVLPLKGGPAVPYPFVAHPAYDAIRMPAND